MNLLEVKNLRVDFPITGGIWKRVQSTVQAVQDVSFVLPVGRTVALVGESGCGKTTVGRSILRLVEPTSGEIRFEGRDVRALSKSELQAWRREVQMIFQDPFSSLNPRMRIRHIVGEAFSIHRQQSHADRKANVLELMRTVGLDEGDLDKFPHEFSGGQRQRIGIARALAVRPKFLVADEPLSALDVSIQAQTVNLLKDLQETYGIAFLFISHDLRMVEFFAHQVVVMYAGRVMETLPASQLRMQARHPYTQALLAAVPVVEAKRKGPRMVLAGDVPDPTHPPTGCVFHPRCPFAEPRCRSETPLLRSLSSDRAVACHLDLVP